MRIGAVLIQVKDASWPVPDAGGEYLGTLEVTQDLTRLRALQGERRLLEDNASPPPSAAGKVHPA